jgi:hypothetical protein
VELQALVWEAVSRERVLDSPVGPKRLAASLKAGAGTQAKTGFTKLSADKPSAKAANAKGNKSGKQGAAGSSVGEETAESPADEKAELAPGGG